MVMIKGRRKGWICFCLETKSMPTNLVLVRKLPRLASVRRVINISILLLDSLLMSLDVVMPPKLLLRT